MSPLLAGKLSGSWPIAKRRSCVAVTGSWAEGYSSSLIKTAVVDAHRAFKDKPSIEVLRNTLGGKKSCVSSSKVSSFTYKSGSQAGLFNILCFDQQRRLFKLSLTSKVTRDLGYQANKKGKK